MFACASRPNQYYTTSFANGAAIGRRVPTRRPVDLIGSSIAVFDRSVGPDHVIGPSRLFFRQASARRSAGGPAPRSGRRAPGSGGPALPSRTPSPPRDRSRTGVRFQRAAGSRPIPIPCAEAARCSNHRPIRAYTAGWMMDSRSCGRAASSEHDVAKPGTIDRAVGSDDLRPEPAAHRVGSWRARRDHVACERVRLDDAHAQAAKSGEHHALPRRDAAGERDAQHQRSRAAPSAARTVFDSSIATVSGPTPPGTGVSAPATSATSGWTSPTISDPCFAKTASRGDPAGNQRPTSSESVTRVDADVDHDGARLHELRRHEGRPPDGRDQDVRRFRDRRAGPASSNGRS